ncbi:MAG: UvrD-helicase domain-containing protein [Candidatus Riflebacteria bacterium]|nr:UvrD-helicase domain-containing protein [Candidatus Riflebacteria bacterium]
MSKERKSLPIEIVSASAGSGKTTHLSEILKDAVGSGRVRPDAVMAMTFTNKAAAELRERVRGTLLAAGKATEAQHLLGARMGTVNAVCGELVSEFAFELGLSPDLQVIDQVVADDLLRDSQAAALSEDLLQEMARVEERFSGHGPKWSGEGEETTWQRAVREVIALARVNGIPPRSLTKHLERSKKEFFSHFLPREEKDGDKLDRRLREAMDACLRETSEQPLLKGDLGAREVVEGLAADFRRHGFLPWSSWAKLAKVAGTKKFDALFEPVREAAACHDVHPRLHRDVETLINAAYNIGCLTMEEFGRRKKEAGVIDFTDQKILALHLLEMPVVRERLAAELDLVLVDEFQDTDPLELAIFLKLAELAPRSVWVGDPKQSIYSFKGADPDLMGNVLDHLGAIPEVLSSSYRSRPPLVELVSSVFAPALKEFGYPPKQVTLQAKRADEAKALGPAVEFWEWDSRNQEIDAACLAAGIRDLIQDGKARVMGTDDRPRPATWKDVAVLCRKNAGCDRLAEALGSLGIPSRLARAGLLATAEAGLVANGLRLWVDPGDALAGATLARTLEFPPDGQNWFEAMLKHPGMEAWRELPSVKKILAAREAALLAGPALAFDQVCAALDVREVCRAWGDAEGRLANLDALRATILAFIGECGMAGQAVTVTGLLQYWDGLAAAEGDGLAEGAGRDAVTLVTWHSAKGLEWPIVVLTDLKEPREESLFGARVVSDHGRLDLSDPLASRWVRFFPWPYGRQRKEIPMGEREAAHPDAADLARRRDFEALRLFYVGWTRARDRLVFAGRNGCFQGKGFDLLGPANDLEFIGETKARWAGYEFSCYHRSPAPAQPVKQKVEPGVSFVLPKPRELHPAWIRPSEAAEPTGRVVEVHDLGPAFPVNGKPDPINLGNAVHAFFAWDAVDIPAKQRQAVAEQILNRWAVAGALSPKHLVEAADRLWSWLARTWPDATWHREWPILHRLPTGSVVAGQIDLFGHPAQRGPAIIIDHKSQSSLSRAEFARVALGYGRQLRQYSDALGMAGVAEGCISLLHFPVGGYVMQVSPV